MDINWLKTSGISEVVTEPAYEGGPVMLNESACYAFIDGWWRMVSSTMTAPRGSRGTGRGTPFWTVNYTCGRLLDSGVPAVVIRQSFDKLEFDDDDDGTGDEYPTYAEIARMAAQRTN